MGTRPEGQKHQFYSVAKFLVTCDSLTPRRSEARLQTEGRKWRRQSHSWEACLQEGVHRRGFGAIHIDLVHQNSLEALAACKLLDVLVAAGLLRQKLITEPHRALRQSSLVFGFELSQCQIAAKSAHCSFSYQGNATIVRPWPANFSSRVAKSCSSNTVF